MTDHNARLHAAQRLQKLGWALTRYGQRIERCCTEPSTEHEKSAEVWLARGRERVREFVSARDGFRKFQPVKNEAAQQSQQSRELAETQKNLCDAMDSLHTSERELAAYKKAIARAESCELDVMPK